MSKRRSRGLGRKTLDNYFIDAVTPCCSNCEHKKDPAKPPCINCLHCVNTENNFKPKVIKDEDL